jgi:2-polyprenyl-6-methoxyphenol hydroxylase-like FAD-dependent oxidoreductase
VSSGGSVAAVRRAGIGIYGEPMDHVVVVGAGIGGLAASLVLSRVAEQVTLVERADHPAEVGAALALQANGMAVLARLGLLPSVERVGARIDRMDIRNAGGRVLLTAKMPDFGGGLDHAVAVRRTQLHQSLLDAVNVEGSVLTRFGCTVMSADPSGSLVVRSGPSGGGSTATTTLHADLVVGADGVNSAVRSTGGFRSRLSAGSSYVRTIVQGQANPWFEEFWTPLGSFGHAPLGGDTTYFWAAAHSPAVTDAVSRRDLGSFAAEWRRVLPLAGELLAKVTSFDDLLINTVRRVDCRRWFAGRLVLLGDAAHAMAPNLGQGANSALGDAVALARGASDRNLGPGGPGALRPRSPSSRPAGSGHGRVPATALQSRSGQGHKGQRRRAHGTGAISSSCRGDHPSRPGRRGPNRQVGIRTRERSLSDQSLGRWGSASAYCKWWSKEIIRRSTGRRIGCTVRIEAAGGSELGDGRRPERTHSKSAMPPFATVPIGRQRLACQSPSHRWTLASGDTETRTDRPTTES